MKDLLATLLIMADEAGATVTPDDFAAIPATEDIDVIRADYSDRLFEAFIGYVSSGGAVTRWKNAARRAIVEDFPAAFYSGYVEAGGEETEADDERELTARMNAEIANLDGLFETLKAWRASEDFTEADIRARVDAWLVGLNSIYSEGKLRGDKNKMLTFDGEDGEESCNECQKYKGQRHSAKWWIALDLVRRNGNDNFGCGRWEPCAHNLFTDDGELWAV